MLILNLIASIYPRLKNNNKDIGIIIQQFLGIFINKMKIVIIKKIKHIFKKSF